MSKPLDLTGKKFSRLTAVRRVGFNPTKWLCECDCGGEKVATLSNLTSGNTMSCGCLNREKRSILGLSNRRATATARASQLFRPEYRAWGSMRSRCLNVAHKNFDNYGGRGITVCRRWAESFDAFLSDMGRRPSARHSLDRIDNSLGYTPDNCRWATAGQQMNNVRYNRHEEIDGVTLTVAEWCRTLGLKRSTIETRMRKRGMSFAEAVAMSATSP